MEVTATATQLQTESGALGKVIEGKQLQDIQLNGRNPIYLALLKPGVRGGSLASFSFGLTTAGLNINGSRTQDNLITYDGAVGVRTRSNGTSIGTADLDQTAEVQILTSSYGAEFGRSAGGQIRVITKSGTRDLHGSAYEYFRNAALDANSWSRNRNPDYQFRRAVQVQPVRLQRQRSGLHSRSSDRPQQGLLHLRRGMGQAAHRTDQPPQRSQPRA